MIARFGTRHPAPSVSHRPVSHRSVSHPPVSHPPLDGPGALAATEGVLGVLAEQAPEVDRSATFPAPSIAALKQARLMSAAIPATFGGHALTTLELADVGFRLGTACGSTAMIWAMHQIQLRCMTPSAEREPRLASYLERAAREQLLIGSVTSEEGVGGSLRTSRAALMPTSGAVALIKRAPTVSYGEAADSLLVTVRRTVDSAAGDQILVLVLAEQARLQPTGTWDTMGMRGTCSGPQVVSARVPDWQVLAQPFGEIAARAMVPVSHILWSAVWSGIAEDALRRAVAAVRARLKGDANGAPNPRLGWMYARHRTMVDSVRQLAAAYDDDPAAGSLAIRANALKMQTSTDAVTIAQLAMEVCGMAGYSEVGPYSVSRQLRDLLSARLMISNDRLNQSTSELVAFGDVV